MSQPLLCLYLWFTVAIGTSGVARETREGTKGRQLGPSQYPRGDTSGPIGILARPDHVWYPVIGIRGGVSLDQ